MQGGNGMNRLTFSIKESGDGFVLLDDQGKTVAWTLDRLLALQILLGLEFLVGSLRQETPEPEEVSDAS